MDERCDDEGGSTAPSLPQPPPSPYRSLRLDAAYARPSPPPEVLPPPEVPPPAPPVVLAPVPPRPRPSRRLRPPDDAPAPPRAGARARRGNGRAVVLLVVLVLAFVVVAAIRSAGGTEARSLPVPTALVASTTTPARPSTTVAPSTTTTLPRPTTTLDPPPTDGYCAALARSHTANLPAGPYVEEFARMTAETAGRAVNADFETVLAQLRTRLARVGPSATIFELWGDLLTNVRAGDPVSRVLSYGTRCAGR